VICATKPLNARNARKKEPRAMVVAIARGLVRVREAFE
jgi:hypothetical protein